MQNFLKLHLSQWKQNCLLINMLQKLIIVKHGQIHIKQNIIAQNYLKQTFEKKKILRDMILCNECIH